MNVEQKVNIHNRFDAHIDNIETGEHRELVGYNIILDQMWTRLCGGNSYFSHIHFGTGTGTPTPERTSLFSHLGTKSAVTEEIIKALPVSSWKRKIVLNPEEYVGETITEVGIAYGSTASNLVTHAMLKDAEGNPISITKTSTDVVTIYATVFITIVNNTPGMVMTGMPNNNALVNYLTGSSSPTGSFGLTEIVNGFNRLGSTPNVAWTSDTINKQRKTNVQRFGITSGNGHVKALEFTNLFSLSLPAPGIFEGQQYSGVGIGVGDGVSKQWQLPSANVNHASVDVFVDGVVVSGVQLRATPIVPARVANPSSLPTDCGRGAALTPDGLVMAVAYDSSPYVTTYDWVDNAWIKRPDPSSLPAGNGTEVALTPDGLVMAVSHFSSPCVTTYDWVDNAWIKRPDPSSLPAGHGNGVALTPDGLVMAVAHYNSPFVTTYDWVDNAWIKRPDPSSLPPNLGSGVALTPDGLVMAVSHFSSPFVSTYDWVDNKWVKRPNPSSLPTDCGRGAALTPDGLVMAVAYDSSPYVTTYDWVDNAWIKRPDPSSLPANLGSGVALTPDGLVMAVSHFSSPFVSTYDWVDNKWVKRPNPSSLPAGHGNGVALTPDGLVMAVAHYNSPCVTTYVNNPITTIEFDTPPSEGAVITADYKVDGLHKTDQYVVDVSFAIQFGEGV
jgi:hypothetical protein